MTLLIASGILAALIGLLLWVLWETREQRERPGAPSWPIIPLPRPMDHMSTADYANAVAVLHDIKGIMAPPIQPQPRTPITATALGTNLYLDMEPQEWNPPRWAGSTTWEQQRYGYLCSTGVYYRDDTATARAAQHAQRAVRLRPRDRRALPPADEPQA